MVVVIALVAPSLLVSLVVSPESLIARNLCVYLILYFPLAAILSANAAIVMLAMWMVGQSAIYQYESGRIMWALTIILQKSSPLQVAAAAVGALGMWVIFRRKIKQQGKYWKMFLKIQNTLILWDYLVLFQVWMKKKLD